MKTIKTNYRGLASLVVVLLLTALASAQTLTGTVKNATTGKPAAGDDVILLSLGQGMEESGRTKSDAKGNFTLKLDDAQAPHLVRAVHQGVTYHRIAPPGTTSVEVEVYDVAKKLEDIQVVADIMRVQAEQGQLEIMRAFAVQNNSKPPRTQMNERNLEFIIPEGAQIIESEAMTAGGQPLKSAPVPVDDKKTRYAYLFPLRPGITQFQLAYQLPYTGSANIDPKSLYPLQHFVAILPKSMQFAAAPGAPFQPMNDPQQPDANVQVASGTALGRTLAFKITGEGTLQTRQENAGEPGEGGSEPNAGPNSERGSGQGPGQGSAQNESRPGGGLGPPIDAPNPLRKYQLFILGGLVLALVIGGVFVASRQQAAQRAGRLAALEAGHEVYDHEISDDEEVLAVAEVAGRRAAATVSPSAQSRSRTASTSSMLLEGLKEELFQLEVEHTQGSISQEEYEKAKAALDQTLQRALKRSGVRPA